MPTSPRFSDHRCGLRAAFTLVELLIVITLLSILAAIVLPNMLNASGQSRHSTLLMNLRVVRTQIQLYREEHNGLNPSLADFSPQMTTSTDIDGNAAATGTSGYPFGPYLQSIPINAATSTDTVGDGEPGTSAWYYNEATGVFLANDSAESRDY